jgi:hypothetical protein
MKTYRVLCECLGLAWRDRRSRGGHQLASGRGVLVHRPRGGGQPVDALPCQRVLVPQKHSRSAAALGWRPVGRRDRRRCLRFGYASLLGPGVLLLAAAVFAGSPYAVKAPGRWFRSVRTSSAAQLDAVARAFAYASPESTGSGCRRTCTSSPMSSYANGGEPVTSHLRDSRQRSKLIAGVAERPMYLDELARRNPSGFGAWLASGPQIAGDPMPYLTADHIDAATVDWDELTRGTG